MPEPKKSFKISELFMSLEGESLYSSRPTVYIRYGMCNLKCPGFNNPTSSKSNTGYASITFNPTDYSNITDMPMISMGCDSQYAVNPEFAHTWESMTTDQIVERLIQIIPHNQWVHPSTKLPVILSLTGGEPMLNAKWFNELLVHPLMQQCQHMLIETNCTVPVSISVAGDINEWLCQDSSRKWTWSNSPKLSNSGEEWKKTIKPAVALSQNRVMGRAPHQVDQYFKFVCGAEEQFIEVQKAMAEYYEGEVTKAPNVWIMPEACSEEQQQAIAQTVAKLCMHYGFLYSHRLQNSLWGNGVGT